MSTSVEASKAAAEPPKTVVSEKKRSKPAAKPVKEKKAKVSKPKSAKTAPHPTYFEVLALYICICTYLFDSHMIFLSFLIFCNFI